MAADIKNITEKFKKLSIDPVYDTNWCDMLVEIKLECIGKMEFAERHDTISNQEKRGRSFNEEKAEGVEDDDSKLIQRRHYCQRNYCDRKFDWLPEVLGPNKIRIFCPTAPIPDLNGIKLPSKFACMSNANHRVTGTEKALTFETRLVALAMSAEHLTGVASAIILSVHVLYQLMVSYLLNQSREDMRRIDKQRTSGPNDA
ncbi:hypothetical protein L5515_010539 [Caenorhabditis briggsae]|uniref:Uncharacterized protein n=1 Tax=Caenorhabditis briggsae TaxID=6238 RepID=A0AAE9ESB7_CAEBR|nr:hypothetical protein L5515_010539 [Caenorhabditis briggsae]